MSRKQPTLREICAAMIVQHFDIPREHAKLMTAEQIMSLIQVDHDPVPFAIARDLGWSPSQYNHPTNLDIKLILAHRTKSAKVDKPRISKSVRISAENERFQARVLGRSRIVDGAQESTGRRGKIQSRPFDKTKRKMQSRPFQKAGKKL